MIQIREILLGSPEPREKRSLTKEETKEATREYVEEMRSRIVAMSAKQFEKWLRR